MALFLLGDNAKDNKGLHMSFLQTMGERFHEGGWGMWPILFCSVVIIGLAVERAVYLMRASVDKDKLLALLKSQVMSGNVQGAIKVCSGNPTPMTRIVQAGLMKFNRTDDEVQAAMDEAALRSLDARDRQAWTERIGARALASGLRSEVDFEVYRQGSAFLRPTS